MPLRNPEAKSSLPETYKDYEVPKNSSHLDKYKGLLYFYKGSKLIGTYKCINTSKDCEKGLSGYDEYNILNTDPLTALDEQPMMLFYLNRYAFVDDSFEQSVEYGDKQYIRTIYLFDVKENKILAEYKDVKHIGVDYWGKGTGTENGDFIVRDVETRKWGIINLKEDGTITEVLPFKYESVNYDEDTGYYILKEDEIWYVYDLEKKEKITPDEKNVIYDVWINTNLTTYYKTGTRRIVGNEEYINYKVYKNDGTAFLVRDNLLNIFATERFVMYLYKEDQSLYFIDYTGEIKYGPIKLYFTELEHDKLHHPAFEFELTNSGFMKMKIYQGQELKYDYDSLYFSTKYWY